MEGKITKYKKLMGYMNLKDDYGNIIQVHKDSCYPKDEQGYWTCSLRKFSYFRGKETDEDANRFNDDIAQY